MCVELKASFKNIGLVGHTCMRLLCRIIAMFGLHPKEELSKIPDKLETISNFKKIIKSFPTVLVSTSKLTFYFLLGQEEGLLGT